MIAKRLALAVSAILFAVILLEAGARVVYRVRNDESFPGPALRERLAPTEDLDRLIPEQEPKEGARGLRLANKVIHPYLGYVFRRDDPSSGAGNDDLHGRAVNRFGFAGIDPLTEPDPDVVRVVVAGGSVALQLFNNGDDALTESLLASPAFAGKRIELVALTVGGYKQPQQMIALSWLLALGAKFDVVINLDGFNEVVLPRADNVPVGVHPSFPRSWDFYQTKVLDTARLDYAAETRRLLEEQRDRRRAYGTGLLSYSAVVLTLLERADTASSEEIARTQATFRQGLNRAGLDFQSTGPFLPYPDDAALVEDLVALWKASSLQMHHLTAATGGRYFHFLQPNQWVKDAKPYSGIERHQFKIRGPFLPRTAVPAAYPELGRAGFELRNTGVAFHSLVRLFSEETRTVYRDTCCHFNALGITAIATEIGRIVGENHEMRVEKDSN